MEHLTEVLSVQVEAGVSSFVMSFVIAETQVPLPTEAYPTKNDMRIITAAV